MVINNITNETIPDSGFIGTSADIVQGLTIAFIALCAIDFIASVLLLYGSIQGKRLLLLPWLIENGFGLFYSILTSIVVVYAMSVGDKVTAGSTVGLLISIFLPVLFSAYIWSAVYSLYNWLAEVDTQRARLLGPPIGKSPYTVYQTYERV